MPPLDSAKARAKAEEARHLSALAESPSFPTYKRIVEADLDRKMSTIFRTAEVSVQQIDYARGWAGALRWAIQVIEGGPKAFEETLEVAKRIEGGED